MRISPIKFGVIVLAAGQSRRMGQVKLLLPWGRTSILGRQVELWKQLPAGQITVVGAKGDTTVQAELDRLGFPESNRILNHWPESGMLGSIRCAANWSGWEAGLTHWVIALGDQPHLRPETLQRLLDFVATSPSKVCQPLYMGRLRHPVVLPRPILQQLGEIRTGTLKTFLTEISGQVAGCEINDEGLGFDIDTPADYQRALADFLAPTASRHDARSAPPG